MTVVAGALGREVLAFTPKRVGRRFDAGRSCAPIESGKWIGQARAAFAGTVVALNDALIQRSSLANRDRPGLPLPSTRRCLSATARWPTYTASARRAASSSAIKASMTSSSASPARI